MLEPRRIWSPSFPLYLLLLHNCVVLFYFSVYHSSISFYVEFKQIYVYLQNFFIVSLWRTLQENSFAFPLHSTIYSGALSYRWIEIHILFYSGIEATCIALHSTTLHFLQSNLAGSVERSFQTFVVANSATVHHTLLWLLCIGQVNQWNSFLEIEL